MLKYQMTYRQKEPACIFEHAACLNLSLAVATVTFCHNVFNDSKRPSQPVQQFACIYKSNVSPATGPYDPFPKDM